MTKEIIYVGIIAAIALIVAVVGIATQTETNTDNLATSSELNTALNRISELEKLEMPTNFVTPTELSNGINGIASHVDVLIGMMETQANLTNQHQIEIVKNTGQIHDNHPVSFEPEKFEEEPVIGEQSTPLIGIGHQITVELEKAEWLKGELVSISGEARVAEGQVVVTITEPKIDEDIDQKVRTLNAIVTNDGRYQIFFGTDFKLSPLGEYAVLVQQRDRISQTISFMLVE